MTNDHMICEGCNEPIFVGQEVLELHFEESYLIHKSLDCLLGLGEVNYGILTGVRTERTLTRIK